MIGWDDSIKKLSFIHLIGISHIFIGILRFEHRTCECVGSPVDGRRTKSTYKVGYGCGTYFRDNHDTLLALGPGNVGYRPPKDTKRRLTLHDETKYNRDPPWAHSLVISYLSKRDAIGMSSNEVCHLVGSKGLAYMDWLPLMRGNLVPRLGSIW